MGFEDRDEQIGGKAWLARAMREFRQRLGVPYPDPSPESPRSIENAAAAARVRQYMTEHAETVEDFAYRSHIGERTLRRLLQEGKASRRTWVEVAHAMGVTPEDLLRTGH
jgi:hypothetical protein